MFFARYGDIWGFLAFSHGWTWAFWTLAALSGESIWEPPAVLLLYIGGIGVPLGGIVMTWVTSGRGGLEELGRRIIDPIRAPFRWWAVILLLFPALTALAAALALWLGAAVEPLNLQAAVGRLAHPGGLLLFAGLVLMLGPLPEEIGWRGYLLDRLQARWSALTASLVLGVLWWAWHLPLFVLPGYFALWGAAPDPLQMLFAILLTSVLITWVYNNTWRSVLAAILFHFMDNFTGELLEPSDEVRVYRMGLMLLLVIFVVLWWGAPALKRPSSSGHH